MEILEIAAIMNVWLSLPVLKRVTDEGSLPEIVQYGPPLFECFYCFQRILQLYFIRSTNNVCFEAQLRGHVEYSFNLKFYNLKVGFKGVCITWTCLRNADQTFLQTVLYTLTSYPSAYSFIRHNNP